MTFRFRYIIQDLKYRLRYILPPKPEPIAQKTKQERRMWCIRKNEKRMRHIRMNVQHRKEYASEYAKDHYRRKYSKYWDIETKYALSPPWLKEK
jgi:hypothetical protein